MENEKPLGYWLKLLDRLIEEDLDRSLEPYGLNRRHWQILNLLVQAPRDAHAIDTDLHAFFTGRSDAARSLRELTAAGWTVMTDSGEASLADDARRRFEEMQASVRSARHRISSGLERADYDMTITTLRTMCRNLGWARPA